MLSVGAILYALGLTLMAYSTTPGMLDLSAGVLVGLGLAGSSFSLVIGAFGKLMPERWRMLAFGAGTAAGSFGQFLFSPLANGVIKGAGWQSALLVFAALLLLVLPLSFALATRGNASKVAGVQQQSAKQALTEAFGHRSFALLVLGFFTCGFQLAFITLHLPAYLIDRGLTAADGAWTIAVIGLFNIVGSILAGWFSSRVPKRYILSFIYLVRALAIVAFITLPASATSAIVFGAVMGLGWLVNRAAHQRARGGDVRYALAHDAGGRGLLQPPGRRLPRRLARRRGLHAHRLVRRRVVARRAVRAPVRRDQSADRGEAGRAARRAAGVRIAANGIMTYIVFLLL